jgi:hypothetical protein
LVSVRDTILEAINAIKRMPASLHLDDINVTICMAVGYSTDERAVVGADRTLTAAQSSAHAEK